MKKASRNRKPRPEDIDPDAVDIAAGGPTPEWDFRPEVVEFDPAIVEAIHARRRLCQITLRVGEEQITEARRSAAESGVGYQTIMRRWLAYGASISRTRHKRRKAG
jgi:hypothetical protein